MQVNWNQLCSNMTNIAGEWQNWSVYRKKYLTHKHTHTLTTCSALSRISKCQTNCCCRPWWWEVEQQPTAQYSGPHCSFISPIRSSLIDRLRRLPQITSVHCLHFRQHSFFYWLNNRSIIVSINPFSYSQVTSRFVTVDTRHNITTGEV